MLPTHQQPFSDKGFKTSGKWKRRASVAGAENGLGGEMMEINRYGSLNAQIHRREIRHPDWNLECQLNATPWTILRRLCKVKFMITASLISRVVKGDMTGVFLACILFMHYVIMMMIR